MRVIWTAAFLAGLALPARADIVDSGTLTMGGQGIFGGTLTVQGNAFSVGGSTFVVGGGSVTLGGRLNAAAAGIRWADGSTSTTAASGAQGAVAVSSVTTIPATGLSQGTLQVCIATVTITTTGGRVAVFAAGALDEHLYNSVNVHHFFGVLRDGNHVSPYDGSHGITGWADNGENYHIVSFYTILQETPSSGSHSYCLSMANDSGRTMVFDAGFTTGVFGAAEVH